MGQFAPPTWEGTMSPDRRGSRRVEERSRLRLGIVGVVIGALLFLVGILVAHFTGLSPRNNVGQEIYPHIPRCAWFEGNPQKCWVLPTSGQIIALVGSQVFLAAMFFGWIFERPLTWARATMAAFMATLELIILFGIVPNQWLGLTQGTFEWSEQKVAFTLPSWLVLNNTVSISYGVIKDAVSGGYAAGLLGGIVVGAYKLQERAKHGGQPKPQVMSTYGRPIVKGSR